MASPERFLARDGDPVRPKLEAFVRHVLGEGVVQVDGPVRETRRDRGRSLVFEPDPVPFVGAFAVRVTSGTSVQVGAGTVNGRTPMIGERFIDGVDEDGESYREGPPRLDLDEGPGYRLRSWITLAVTIDPETGAMAEAQEGLQIAHRSDLPAAFEEGFAPDEDGVGHWPLAQVTWSADGARVSRVRQMIYFDQVHRYQPGEDGAPGRHRWRPV